MIHFFRRAKSDSATCFNALRMSIGYRLLCVSPDTSVIIVGCRRIREWSSSPCEEDDLNGAQQDQEVEEKREILDVVEVILQFLERVVYRGAIAILDLSPAREAGLHGQPLHVVRDLFLKRVDEFRSLGARADEAHVPDQDIEELRELVEP